ncbi:MAG: tetratricopeptide repeat protein [Candidatus Pelagibacter sp.]
MDPKINTILRFIKEKKLKDAEEKCVEILHKYHNNPEFLNIFAIILFQLKKYNDAINKWKKAILSK